MRKIKLLPLLLILLLLFTQGVSVAKGNEYKVIIDFKYDEIIHQENEKLYTVYQGEKKSAVVDENGKFLVNLRPGRIDLFSEGLAPICINNKYGFINKAGKMVIPPKWDYVDTFHEGRAWVYNNYKFGYIDVTGKYLVPLKYGYAEYYSDGAAPVVEWPSPNTTKGWGLFHVFEFARIAGLGKWGLIDKNGKVLVKPQYASISIMTGYEKLFTFSVEVKGGYKSGLMDSSGKVLLKPVLDSVTCFSQGWNYSAVKKDGKWGFIDRTGKIVSEFLWNQEPKPIETPNKLWIVSKTVDDSKYYGALDDNMNVVIEPKWKYIDDNFYEGISVITGEDGDGFISDEGKIIVEPQLYKANRFYNGIAWVCGSRDETESIEGEQYIERTRNCWRPVDKTGNYLSATGWDRVTDFRNGYAAVSNEDGKSTIIDMNLNKICDLDFNVVNCPSGDYFVFKKYDKYGLVDKSGKIINKAEWSDCDFENFLPMGITAQLVKESWKDGDKYGLLGKSGKLICNTFWDEYDNSVDGTLIPIKLNNKWGLMNSVYETIAVTPQFDDIRYEFNKKGKSIWTAKKNGKFGVIEINVPT